MYEKIRKWYMLGLWTTEMVQNSVEKGILTEAEATEILGE
jgi:hypothetical protein